MKDNFLKSLVKLGEQNPKLMVLTADLGFGLFEEFIQKYPNQYLNVGVAEQNMIGVASGLALDGYKVFVYSIANFSTFRCLEQVRNDICYHDLDITIIGFGGGFSYGPLGMTHHATEDIGIMRVLPNMTVIVPSNLWEVDNAMLALGNYHKPTYLRLDRITSPLGSSFENKNLVFELGKSIRLVDGTDLTIFICGSILSEALLIATELAKKNISARIVSMHTIKPLDTAAILSAINDTQAIITLEEHNIIGGLGSAVAEYCMEKNARLKYFKRFGLRDTFSEIVGNREFLLDQYQINTKHVVNEVLSNF